MGKVFLFVFVVGVFIALLAIMVASCANHAPVEDMSHKDSAGITQWLQQHQ